jgi:hypothetical protein
LFSKTVQLTLSIFLAQLAVPLGFTIIALIVVKTLPQSAELPSLILDLNKFTKSAVAMANQGPLDIDTSKILSSYT